MEDPGGAGVFALTIQEVAHLDRKGSKISQFELGPAPTERAKHSRSKALFV